MTYTDLRDFEPEIVFEIPGFEGDDAPLSIAIAKAGGGTLGRAYDGLWQAVATYDGRELYRGGDLNIARPHTHRQAAAVLAQFLAAEHEGTSLDARLAAWAVGDLD
jgi:hypothetical protein